MDNKYFIERIKGILYYEDIPLIDFCISGYQLIYAKEINKVRYPVYMYVLGLTYEAFNSFFNDRVVRDHAQDLRDYLDFLKLKHYDFDQMIIKMNGWDALGNWWVRFEDMGAQCWNDILTQKYPIY